MAAGGARPGVGVPGARDRPGCEAFARFSLLHLDDGKITSPTTRRCSAPGRARPSPRRSTAPARAPRAPEALLAIARVRARRARRARPQVPLLGRPPRRARAGRRARVRARRDKTVAIRPRGEDAPYVVAKATPAAPTDHAAPRGGKNNTAAPSPRAHRPRGASSSPRRTSRSSPPPRELVRLAADARRPPPPTRERPDARGARRDRSPRSWMPSSRALDERINRRRRRGLTAEGLPARLFGRSVTLFRLARDAPDAAGASAGASSSPTGARVGSRTPPAPRARSTRTRGPGNSSPRREDASR